MLNGNARPMIHGIGEPVAAGLPSDDNAVPGAKPWFSACKKQGKIQGNLDFEIESRALCLAGADFSGSLVRSLIKNNRESNFDNREVHSPRTGKNC